MKLYCLSGLGVDHRAFRNLTIEGIELVHIPWIEHLKNETLDAYAKRLFFSANIPNDYNLVGVSFGGMIAQEFEKIRQPKSLFLVSTISGSPELPRVLKFLGRLKLYNIVPRFALNRANRITYYLFGAKVEEDRQLLREILRDSDATFLRWAMGAIVKWNAQANTQGITIHGGSDRILPKAKPVKFCISNAGHFMIVTHGKEVSNLSCWKDQLG